MSEEQSADGGQYGHQGPFTETERSFRGRDPVTVIQCDRCGVAVPIEEPDQLVRYSCDRYAEISAAITGNLDPTATSDRDSGSDDSDSDSGDGADR